jgi:exosortase
MPSADSLPLSTKSTRPAAAATGEAPPVDAPSRTRRTLIGIGVGVLAATFAWAYWPTLAGLVRAWNREPDYSHGFLVAPLAVFFLWARRDRLPPRVGRLAWPGMVLLAASVAARFVSGRYYLEALDGWSMVLWVAGAVWLFAGGKRFWWSLPSIVFLLFMVPLPFRLERALSLPLQTIATKMSCWLLVLLGQPAWPQGHTILLAEHRLEVEQACSGLRIFMGIAALAFAYVILARRTWWERLLLLLSAVPIALLANATRIVITGLLYRLASDETAKKFAHDSAGWVMILFAAGLFALVLWYLTSLFKEVELVQVGALVRREREQTDPVRP